MPKSDRSVFAYGQNAKGVLQLTVAKGSIVRAAIRGALLTSGHICGSGESGQVTLRYSRIRFGFQTARKDLGYKRALDSSYNLRYEFFALDFPACAH